MSAEAVIPKLRMLGNRRDVHTFVTNGGVQISETGASVAAIVRGQGGVAGGSERAGGEDNGENRQTKRRHECLSIAGTLDEMEQPNIDSAEYADGEIDRDDDERRDDEDSDKDKDGDQHNQSVRPSALSCQPKLSRR